MSYLVGIDIGGTFTDCAIVDGAGKLLTTKVPSTPADFARGMMDALDAGAQALGVPLAPALFSTTTGWPSDSESLPPTSRAMKSAAPPGGTVTNRRRGRFG